MDIPQIYARSPLLCLYKFRLDMFYSALTAIHVTKTASRSLSGPLTSRSALGCSVKRQPLPSG